MHERILNFLLSHGLSQATLDKLAALPGHAREIVHMVVVDGVGAAEAFIEAEYAKVVDALKP